MARTSTRGPTRSTTRSAGWSLPACRTSTSLTACPLPTARQPGTRVDYNDAGWVTRRTNPDATFVDDGLHDADRPESPGGDHRRERPCDNPDLRGHRQSGERATAQLHGCCGECRRPTGYDDLGNLTQVSLTGAGHRPDERDARVGLRCQQPARPPDPARIRAPSTYQYDGFGRLWQQTDALGQQSTYTYDDENRLTDITTSPNADHWSHAELRRMGQPGRSRRNGPGDDDHSTTMPTTGSTWRTDDLNGRTFKSGYEYDANDQLTDICLPVGQPRRLRLRPPAARAGPRHDAQSRVRHGLRLPSFRRPGELHDRERSRPLRHLRRPLSAVTRSPAVTAR